MYIFAIFQCSVAVNAAESIGGKSNPVNFVVGQNTKLFLRLPDDERLIFRGVVSFDKAGQNSNGMLYPAPNAIGFLAGVFTHGLLVESSKNSQKDKIQEAANKVLLQYQPVIETFQYRDFMRQALARIKRNTNVKLIARSDNPGNELVIETTPIFGLTQDQKAIVLDNDINIYRFGEAPESGFRKTIRIVSRAREEDMPEPFWTDNNGEQLKDTSTFLLAESFEIALLDATGSMPNESAVQKTIRYREGSIEKFERAQVVMHLCDRMLIRTLRGDLMSIPNRNEAENSSEQCQGSAGNPNN
jgi:hypothetical protein